jgi:hypothetical protein
MTTEHNFEARRIVVLADCHIHPGGGPDWSPAVLEAIAPADLIVTLGDMGETAGLDRLANVAPVIGVRGADDAPDARTEAPLRVLRFGEARVGCVFDPKLHGLAAEADPFSPASGWMQKAAELFGGPIEVLLYASTHKPHVAEVDGLLLVNPGSAVLPAKGAPASFARLTIEDGRVRAQIATVPD